MLRFSRSRAAVAQSLCQAVRVKTEDANQCAFPFKLNHTKRGHERGLTSAAEGCCQCAWPQAGPSGCQAQRSDKEEGGGKGGSRPASPSPTRQLAAPERFSGSAHRATGLSACPAQRRQLARSSAASIRRRNPERGVGGEEEGH